MRFHSSLALLGLSVLVLGLAGCQSNAKQSTASFKNSSAKSSSYSAPKPDAAVSGSSSTKKEAQTYRPKAAQTRSAHYVKSGKLKTAGQYTYDKVGTKLQLDQVKHPRTTIKSGPLTYKVTTVRIIKNTAKTAAAKRMAAQALNLASIKSPYYTIQVKFTITNHGKRDVTTDGIKTLRLSQNRQLNASGQLSDASAGKTIPANDHLTTFATGLASEKKRPTFKSVKIAFAGAYADSKQVVAPTGWLKLAL
ncbi:MAG: hypothetical protein LKH74_01945 [Levilactobacillus sp.]|jgi:hypothetical protein|uniref:DUF4352 domain-containing protein n=1 Tax=Levilactobacillus suantsaiihabitans TaxID=2487722 RepID=A0A4Z0J7W1_9LACO|nr:MULTISPECIES: hypothetical protein [Levilactobacillus]MCH4123190.1 hypothetical protein [Levilactobacillus sp.]MCI1552672.1 hypothetical protein [Levilactobacillus sp.]MCI1606643.1 hypothetical protein [Levilactobacillus sp.]TGD18744.1 hypothetical protein EGT51_07620 [Levilactobacillus suantsaiihabitans]